jgi:hypothetical protein
MAGVERDADFQRSLSQPRAGATVDSATRTLRDLQERYPACR